MQAPLDGRFGWRHLGVGDELVVVVHAIATGEAARGPPGGRRLCRDREPMIVLLAVAANHRVGLLGGGCPDQSQFAARRRPLRSRLADCPPGRACAAASFCPRPLASMSATFAPFGPAASPPTGHLSSRRDAAPPGPDRPPGPRLADGAAMATLGSSMPPPNPGVVPRRRSPRDLVYRLGYRRCGGELRWRPAKAARRIVRTEPLRLRCWAGYSGCSHRRRPGRRRLDGHPVGGRTRRRGARRARPTAGSGRGRRGRRGRRVVASRAGVARREAAVERPAGPGVVWRGRAGVVWHGRAGVVWPRDAAVGGDRAAVAARTGVALDAAGVPGIRVVEAAVLAPAATASWFRRRRVLAAAATRVLAAAAGVRPVPSSSLVWSLPSSSSPSSSVHVAAELGHDVVVQVGRAGYMRSRTRRCPRGRPASTSP